MIVNPGIEGQRINFDKVYVKSNGIRADISISVPIGAALSSVEKTFRFATRSSNTRLADQNVTKTLVFAKSLSGATGYADVSLRYTKENLISSDGAVNTYKLGTIEIPHTIEQFEGRNISLFGMELILADNTDPAKIASYAPLIASSFLDIKVSNAIQDEENVIFQSTFEGPTSFFAKAQEATPQKTENPAAFSDLFPSVVDNTVNLLFFLDKRKVLEKNTTLFSLLSKTSQEKAVAGTNLVRKTLVKIQESPEDFKAPEFSSNEFKLEEAATTDLDLGESIIGLYGEDQIKEYTKNLKFKYKTNLLFTNGIYPIVDRLINNIEEIQAFESFMNGVFQNIALYDGKNEAFTEGAINVIKADLQRDLGVQDTDYFVSLINEVLGATSKFDTPESKEQIQLAEQQMLKLVNLEGNQYSFELFFSTFNKLTAILQDFFLGVGFVLPGSFSGQGKPNESPNPEKTTVKIEHNFDYRLDTGHQSLRFAYIPAKNGSGFPTITGEEYENLLNQNTSKYFLGEPSINMSFRQEENEEGVVVAPEIGSYLTINQVKNKDKVIFDNDRPIFFSEIGEIQDARLNYLLAISVLKNKLQNIKIDQLQKLDKESTSLKTRLFNAINDVYNLISFVPFPPVVDVGDDFKRETADSILQGAIANNELRPTEEETTELVEAIYNINENITNLEDLNSAVQNNLELLIVFLDYIESVIQNPYSYNQKLVDSRLRTPEVLIRSIRNLSGPLENAVGGRQVRRIALPYPVYALYEALQSSEQGRLTFSWAGGQQVLEQPINSSFIRFNFANIKEVQALTGFSLLANGEVSLKDPIFTKISETPQDKSLLFCRVSNYNIGNENNLWYLNNNNTLHLPAEAEYFFIQN